MTTIHLRIALIGIVAAVAECPQPGGGLQAGAPPAAPPLRIEAKHVPNVLKLNDKVLSGGQPEGEAGFEELRALGIETIVSVDGARPDVDVAKKHGMRYVHLPHGYDGITEQRLQELAKAVRDLAGPIYIHCHHGQHRSPAAAAAACVSAGLLEHEDAEAVLKTAGTGENYRGLFQAVEKARRLDDAALDALQVEFQEIAELPPLAEAMVAIEHTHDHLQAMSLAGWKALPEHPDLDPQHEALLLKEHFTELLRTDEVRAKAERFQALLRESEQAAGELEAALSDWDGTPESPKRIRAPFQRITDHCAACHREFRDVPLDGK